MNHAAIPVLVVLAGVVYGLRATGRTKTVSFTLGIAGLAVIAQLILELTL